MISVGAVVVPCASKKCAPSTEALTAGTLGTSTQEAVVADWLTRLRAAQPVCRADELYEGRTFRMALAVARDARAPIFSISAGLGIVPGVMRVPSYNLTLNARDLQSISRRVQGRFNPIHWWQLVVSGPFSTSWQDALSGNGLILMALSRPYARLICSDLEAFAPEPLQRLRLFGLGLEKILPSAARKQLMPYDGRLDSISAGTKSDFAARALDHFWRSGPPATDADADSNFVEQLLSDYSAPPAIRRPRLGDEELIVRIEAHLRDVTGIQRVLRRLRDHDRVACEQGRFTRLYHMAVERTGRDTRRERAI